MRSLAFIAEQNIRQTGKTVHQSWEEIPGARFASMAEAVQFVLDYDLAQGRRIPTRVLERVAAANGALIDHQVFPHWDPKVRELKALRAREPLDLDWAGAADAGQDPADAPAEPTVESASLGKAA